MPQQLQPGLYALLSGDAAVTAQLASASAIKPVSAFDADDALPEVLVQYAGGMPTQQSDDGAGQSFEDYYIYAADRDNAYYRIAGILDAVRDALDGQSITITTGKTRVFRVQWLRDLPWDSSKPFRMEIGGALYRVFLSRS